MNEFSLTELRGSFILTIGNISIGFEHYEVHEDSLHIYGPSEKINFSINSPALEKAVLDKLHEIDVK
jgi:hypothetical protein